MKLSSVIALNFIREICNEHRTEDSEHGILFGEIASIINRVVESDPAEMIEIDFNESRAL